jgi:hypothetical protein
MRPASLIKTRKQMHVYMNTRVSGRDPKTKRKILRQHAVIAEVVYKRWHIGVYQLQAKHCRWFLEVYLIDCAPGTKYRYYLRLREILTGLGKYRDWEPLLRGPWTNPEGRPHQKKTNRGRKPKFRPKVREQPN